MLEDLVAFVAFIDGLSWMKLEVVREVLFLREGLVALIAGEHLGVGLGLLVVESLVLLEVLHSRERLLALVALLGVVGIMQ